MAFARENPERLCFVDQCALNYVLQDQWLELPDRFNLQSLSREGRQVTRETVAQASIVHFTGSGKPWEIWTSHPATGLYWRARQRTPFADFPRMMLVSSVCRARRCWHRCRPPVGVPKP
jgi:lipopolysaccharide biosynthesis glycosyltransferase